jgi:hypothetical protein
VFGNDPLGIYLNDHLAGAAGAIELGERLAGETAGSDIGPSVARLIDDIKADRATLEQLMDGLGISRDPLKQGLGWMGEKLSRLKLAIGSGPDELGRLLSLEALSVGVQGKLSLWRSLQTIAAGRPALAGTDLDGLVERARAQLSTLDGLRASTAPAALAAVAEDPAT